MFFVFLLFYIRYYSFVIIRLVPGTIEIFILLEMDYIIFYICKEFLFSAFRAG